MCKFPESKSQKSPLELWKKKKFPKLPPNFGNPSIFSISNIQFQNSRYGVAGVDGVKDGEMMRHDDLLDDGFDVVGL